MKATQTVLVCGSREWGDVERIDARLSQLGRGTTIIHGAAREARRRGIPVEVIRWETRWGL